jgi:hypothetical protein
VNGTLAVVVFLIGHVRSLGQDSMPVRPGIAVG